MVFVSYLPTEIVVSYSPVFVIENDFVYEDNGTFFLCIQINQNVYAKYAWNEYDTLAEKEKIEMYKIKHDEAIRMYQNTIQVVFDTFPRTIRDDVYCLIHRYNANSLIGSQERITIVDYGFVKLITNLNKSLWEIYIYSQLFCCITNEKAARQIFLSITKDCENLIKGRWLKSTDIKNAPK